MQTIQTIHIGHLNIVDHLILGIAASDAGPLQDGPPCNIRPVPLKAWDPICQGLEAGDLDAAMINIPLAMNLHGAGLDISLVMLAHRGGSLLAARTGQTRLSGFRGKSLLIPHRFSIQHILMHKLMADQGLCLEPASASSRDSVCAEIVPPALMPDMTLKDEDGDIAGFISPDPFAARAAELGHMVPLLTTQNLWKDHPCCGVVVRRHLLEDPDTLGPLVRRMFNAASFLDNRLTDPDGPGPETIAAAAAFLDQSPECTLRALTRSGVTYRPDLLIPEQPPLNTIQEYMVTVMGLMPAATDLDTFVQPQFAQNAYSELSP